MSTKSRFAPALIAATAAATVGIGLATAPPASALTGRCPTGPSSFALQQRGGFGGGGLWERWHNPFFPHQTKTKAQ